MTLHQAVPIYCRCHIDRHYARATMITRQLFRYLLQLPDIELGHLQRIQVVEWYHAIGAEHAAMATCMLAHLHLLYRKMFRWGHYNGPNPATEIDKFKKVKRTVTVPDAQIPALLEVIGQQPPTIRLYFLTILLCGVRRDELRLAQWRHFDLESGIWLIPQPKNNEPHKLVLPPELVGLYRQIEQVGPWVFTCEGAAPWGATTVERYWQRIRTRCGLDHVRIHDLRRTLISRLCDQGQAGLAQIIANHKSRTTTEGYWQRGASPEAAAALAAYAKRIMGQEARA